MSFQAFTVYLVITVVFWVVIPLTIMFLPTFGGMCYVLLQDVSWIRWMLKWLVWGYVSLIGLCTVRTVINHRHRQTGRQLFTETMGIGCSKWNQYLNQIINFLSYTSVMTEKTITWVYKLVYPVYRISNVNFGYQEWSGINVYTDHTDKS